jgi:hypothetical protein
MFEIINFHFRQKNIFYIIYDIRYWITLLAFGQRLKIKKDRMRKVKISHTSSHHQ